MLKPIAAIVAGLIGVATVMCANSDVFVNVATFGADGSDYEDDTIAIQRAIDFATKDGRGDTVFFPKGRYIISSTIKIENTAGLTFKGAGSWATRFEWYGDDSSPMFLLRDVRDSVFENFGINATPDRTFLETAIQCENGPDNKIPPSHDIFRNIIMDGTNKGIGKGIRFALGAGGDNNNEFHHIDNVTVYNYTTAAFSLEHSQVKTVLFTNCNCLNGERCVATNQGEYGHGGSFFWYGGGGGYNRVADFDLGEADDIIVISGANFELSSSFLKTPGPSGSPWPVLIEGVR